MTTRRTVKQRMMNIIIEEMETMLFDDNPPDCAPSIDEVAFRITTKELKPSAHAMAHSILLDEYTELTGRYYRECCKHIGNEYEINYHPVTKAFFDDGEPEPTTEEQARRYLAMFANGRNRASHGARFLLEQDAANPDLMHSVYMKQRCNTSDANHNKVATLLGQAEVAGHIQIKGNIPKQLPPTDIAIIEEEEEEDDIVTEENSNEQRKYK